MKKSLAIAWLLAGLFAFVGSALAQGGPGGGPGPVPNPWITNGATIYYNKGGVQVGPATGGGLGAGTINVSGGYFVNGVAIGAATSIVVGTTNITGGTPNGVLFDNAGKLGNTAAAASSILVTNGSSVPAFSTTLPAHTLGGTVSGGGNQINNVVIGASTPLAGSFTALTVTTSVTATGLIGLPNLASQSANTILAAASAGSPIAMSVPSCSTSASALQWVTGTGLQCATISASAASVTVGSTTVLSGTTTRILYDNAGVLGEYTISGSGTVVAMATAPAIVGGSHTAITSLGIRSTGSGAFDMTIANTENLTAGRTLTITLNDAARTLNMGGNVTFGNSFQTGTSSLILTTTGATNVTLPTTGTLATLAGVEALTNKTVNGLTITTTTGTLTIANGKTFTVNNSVAISGTDSTTMTFPSTSATIARTDTGQTFTGTNTFGVINSGVHTITSSSANALAVGLNGATNPAFNVDASTASSATGWNVKSAAAAAGAALSVISSGTNENGTIDAKGSGTLTLNATATGGITLARAVTLSSTINKYTLTAPATGATLTIADGKTHVVSNSITLAGTDSTTWTGASSNMTLAALNLQNQVVTGGATTTPPSAQTTSFTVNCGLGPIQNITGPTSAWSITAPANASSCFFILTNASSSAVVPTFSGFSVGSNTGDALTSVGSSKFLIWVGGNSSVWTYSIKALQ